MYHTQSLEESIMRANGVLPRDVDLLTDVIVCNDDEAEINRETLSTNDAVQQCEGIEICAPTTKTSTPALTNVLRQILKRKRQATFRLLPLPSERHRTSTASGGRRKSVQFNPKAQVRLILGLQDFSSQEIAATWFSQKEFQEIQTDCIKQIGKLELGMAFSDINYCARGLETHCGTRALVKAKNRALAIQSGLEEQARQWTLATEDGSIDAIALVYHHASSSSQIWAHVVGLHDQRDTEELWEETFYSESNFLVSNRWTA